WPGTLRRAPRSGRWPSSTSTGCWPTCATACTTSSAGPSAGTPSSRPRSTTRRCARASLWRRPAHRTATSSTSPAGPSAAAPTRWRGSPGTACRRASCGCGTTATGARPGSPSRGCCAGWPPGDRSPWSSTTTPRSAPRTRRPATACCGPTGCPPDRRSPRRRRPRAAP
ncbi:MAG: hypothetical protein, SCM10.04c, partial [uncultured Frankineae bacterium]